MKNLYYVMLNCLITAYEWCIIIDISIMYQHFMPSYLVPPKYFIVM